MSRLAIRTESQLQAPTLQALEKVKLGGKLPDVYLQFANSEPALRAYLHMEASVREGSLSTMEVEAVKLWVSEQTGCEFCLSVHSFKAQQAGLSKQQQLDIRRHGLIAENSMGDYPDACHRINGLLGIARTIHSRRGNIAQSELDEARKAGISDENMVDLTMVISTIFFTNITNHINDTQSSLPPAPDL